MPLHTSQNVHQGKSRVRLPVNPRTPSDPSLSDGLKVRPSEPHAGLGVNAGLSHHQGRKTILPTRGRAGALSKALLGPNEVAGHLPPFGAQDAARPAREETESQSGRDLARGWLRAPSTLPPSLQRPHLRPNGGEMGLGNRWKHGQGFGDQEGPDAVTGPDLGTCGSQGCCGVASPEGTVPPDLHSPGARPSRSGPHPAGALPPGPEGEARRTCQPPATGSRKGPPLGG